MMITSNITMDLQKPGSLPVIYGVQNDRYCRNLALTLLCGGSAWNVPESAKVLVRYCKSDGVGGEYDTLPDGTKAWHVDGNVITVALAPQVMTVPGHVRLTVVLQSGEGQVSSFGVLLQVQPGVKPVAESEPYVHMTGYMPAPDMAEQGQVIRITAVDESGHIVSVEAVDPDDLYGNGESADDALLAGIYTLVREDFLHGVWDGPKDADADMPFYTDVGDKFCTRKFNTSQLPRVVYHYFTDPLQYIFWNNGEFAGKKDYGQLREDWSVEFEFDQVAIIFSWGWESIDTEVILRLSGFGGYFNRVLVMGDSISADYYGNYDKWVTKLINDGFFPATTINNSIHATGFVAEYTEEGDVDNNFLQRIQAVEGKEKFDLVVVFGGINDFIQSIPMGEDSDNAAVNFIPAVDSFFAYLLNNFTKAKIAVITPLRTYNTYPNGQGHYQTEYADCIRNTAKKYCLPVLNLTEESGFCPFVEAFKNQWTLVPEGFDTADGVHPNEEWEKKFLAPQIRAFLERFV